MGGICGVVQAAGVARTLNWLEARISAARGLDALRRGKSQGKVDHFELEAGLMHSAWPADPTLAYSFVYSCVLLGVGHGMMTPCRCAAGRVAHHDGVEKQSRGACSTNRWCQHGLRTVADRVQGTRRGRSSRMKMRGIAPNLRESVPNFKDTKSNKRELTLALSG